MKRKAKQPDDAKYANYRKIRKALRLITDSLYSFIYSTNQNLLGTSYMQATECQEAYKDEKLGTNPAFNIAVI